jgi:ABC-type amino acid transport substrate-binding protein
MRIVRFILVLVILLGIGLGTLQAAEKVAVRLFLQENLDPQGKQVVLDPKMIEVLDYFERRAGLKFETVILPWKRAQIETLDGKGIIYGFSRSAERNRVYHFSQPFVIEKIWGVTYGSPKPKYKRPEDLRGKVVSIGRGFSHGMEFDQARDVIFTVQEDSASIIARFKKLMAKRSDVMVWPIRGLEHTKDVENYINRVLVQESNDPELKGVHFDVTENPLFLDTTHFASAQGKYVDVIAKIDKAIARGKKDGSLAAVLRDYH